MSGTQYDRFIAVKDRLEREWMQRRRMRAKRRYGTEKYIIGPEATPDWIMRKAARITGYPWSEE